MNDLEKRVEELEDKVKQLTLDITHMKAHDIITARQLEDSQINRGLLKDLVDAMHYRHVAISEETTKLLNDVMDNHQIDSIIYELKQGNKLLAIKKVREITGWGLKDAKDMIDGLCLKLGL